MEKSYINVDNKTTKLLRNKLPLSILLGWNVLSSKFVLAVTLLAFICDMRGSNVGWHKHYEYYKHYKYYKYYKYYGFWALFPVCVGKWQPGASNKARTVFFHNLSTSLFMYRPIIRRYVCMYVCIYVCMYTCVGTCVFMCMYVWMYVCVCMYVIK
jgi:hypothetical protein